MQVDMEWLGGHGQNDDDGQHLGALPGIGTLPCRAVDVNYGARDEVEAMEVGEDDEDMELRALPTDHPRRRRRQRCSRCWRRHDDYTWTVRIYGFDQFDCTVILPDEASLRAWRVDMEWMARREKSTVAEVVNLDDSVPESVDAVPDSLAGDSYVPDSLGE